MAVTPMQVSIPLTGKLVIRLDNGAEVVVGDIVYNADVAFEVGTAPEKFTFVSRKPPIEHGLQIQP